MKRLNVFGMAILGMLFLSMMFNACQKDEELMQVQSDELEVRAKPCTSTKYATIKAEVPDVPDGQDVWNALHTRLTQVEIKTKHEVLHQVLSDLKQELCKDHYPNHYLCECTPIADYMNEPGIYGWGMTHIRWGIAKGQLVIVVVSYELNEENAPANYVAHEDFHTYVAKEIVKQCAEVAAERTGEPCLEAGDATVAILEGLMQEAQDLYDEMCDNCNYENNRADAREAVKIVVNEFLNS